MLGPEKIIEQRYAPRVYLPCLTIGLVLVQLVYVFLKKVKSRTYPCSLIIAQPSYSAIATLSYTFFLFN